MSIRLSRALLGNLLVMLVLAAIAWLLLRLHLADSGWMLDTRARSLQLALASVLGYAGLCTLLWWRDRKSVV